MTRYKVTINSDKTLTCYSHKSLMDSLVLQKGTAPKGCHQGGCGVCKVKILSGSYSTKKMNRKHVSEKEELQNIALACRVFPQSDINIEFIPQIKPLAYKLGN